MNRMIWVLACSTVCALAAGSPPVFAIRGARIVTVSGASLERGTVVIRGGLIEAVGAEAGVPADAWVIEGAGLTVYPGLIDALSTLGLPEPAPGGATTVVATRRPDSPGPPGAVSSTAAPPPASGPEDRPSNTSWLRAADVVNPSDRRIEAARSAGFTTAVTFPSRGIFAGQGAVINLAGEKAGQMVVSSSAGLYLTLSSGSMSSFPGSLLGVLAYIRQVYLDCEHYRQARAMYQAQPAGKTRPAYDRALEGVLEVTQVLLPASRAVELDRMVRFASELQTPAVLYGGHEAFKAIGVLRKSGTPLLVSLKWPERSREANPEDVESLRTLELREQAPAVPSLLAKAGVRFAFYSDGVAGSREIVRAVRRAIDAGLSPADAVRAFTLSPAEIYGVADRLGSIEPGKIANLVVTSGELFQEKAQVKYVFIDGAKFEPLPEGSEEVRQ